MSDDTCHLDMIDICTVGCGEGWILNYEHNNEVGTSQVFLKKDGVYKV